MDFIQWVVNQIEKPIKMIMYRFNFDKWSCRHCDGKGVCKNGYKAATGEKYSCQTCIKAFDPEWRGITEHKRVKCSICNGTGRSDEYLKRKGLPNPSETKLIED